MFALQYLSLSSVFVCFIIFASRDDLFLIHNRGSNIQQHQNSYLLIYEWCDMSMLVGKILYNCSPSSLKYERVVLRKWCCTMKNSPFLSPDLGYDHWQSIRPQNQSNTKRDYYQGSILCQLMGQMTGFDSNGFNQLMIKLWSSCKSFFIKNSLDFVNGLKHENSLKICLSFFQNFWLVSWKS